MKTIASKHNAIDLVHNYLIKTTMLMPKLMRLMTKVKRPLSPTLLGLQ